MPNADADAFRPRHKVRYASVYEEDYDYIFRRLAGGAEGLPSTTFCLLLHAFAEFLRQKQLQPYAIDPTTPERILRYLTHGEFVIRPRTAAASGNAGGNPPRVS